MQRLLFVTAIVMATAMVTAGFAKDFPEIPQGAIDLLLKKPNLATMFDEKFGKGSAKVIFEENGIDTRTDAEKREDEDSKRIQTANEVIPKGKFITDIGEMPARFVMVYKGKVYTCGNIVKRRDIPIGCEQNPDK